MPRPTSPMGERPSMFDRRPGLRQSVELVRRTILPPKKESRWKRMVVTGAGIGGLGFAAYVGTGSAAWAVLLLVVGIPVVVLPTILVIGMFLEAREEAASR
jgi:hypothetical protein